MPFVKETTKTYLQPEQQDIIRVTLGSGEAAFTLLYRLREVNGGPPGDMQEFTVAVSELTVEQQATLTALWAIVVAKAVAASGPFAEQ